MHIKNLKYVLPVVLVSGFSNTSIADSIIKIEDFDKQVIKKTPYVVEVCYDRQVQGTKNGKSDIQNFMEGAVAGGLLGNNIKGEENGGAIGAFLGGVLNTERNKGTVGTQTECVSETRYKEEYMHMYSHSQITFEYQGKTYTVNFSK
tara:strand:+ start:1123 stop:1563 length:441 start_codon:yes stop_codon:yes gene_type:complete